MNGIHLVRLSFVKVVLCTVRLLQRKADAVSALHTLTDFSTTEVVVLWFLSLTHRGGTGLPEVEKLTRVRPEACVSETLHAHMRVCVCTYWVAM